MDVAVGTTYCLGLGSLLLPPLAMAAHDQKNADDDQATGIALLEAVRRFAAEGNGRVYARYAAK